MTTEPAASAGQRTIHPTDSREARAASIVGWFVSFHSDSTRRLDLKTTDVGELVLDL